MDATLKRIKSVHFVLQISPWKQGLQKKWSTPRRSQRKILRNWHLNFFISLLPWRSEVGYLCRTSVISFCKQGDKERENGYFSSKEEKRPGERRGETRREKREKNHTTTSRHLSSPRGLVNTFCTLRKIKHSISGSYSINTYLSICPWCHRETVLRLLKKTTHYCGEFLVL